MIPLQFDTSPKRPHDPVAEMRRRRRMRRRDRRWAKAWERDGRPGTIDDYLRDRRWAAW